MGYNQLPLERRLKARCCKHGITEDQFWSILYIQNFACSVCDEPIEVHGSSNSAIEHCHTTQIIRGITCSRCNSIIAKVENFLGGDCSRIQKHLERRFISNGEVLKRAEPLSMIDHKRAQQIAARK